MQDLRIQPGRAAVIADPGQAGAIVGVVAALDVTIQTMSPVEVLVVLIVVPIPVVLNDADLDIALPAVHTHRWCGTESDVDIAGRRFFGACVSHTEQTQADCQQAGQHPCQFFHEQYLFLAGFVIRSFLYSR